MEIKDLLRRIDSINKNWQIEPAEYEFIKSLIRGGADLVINHPTLVEHSHRKPTRHLEIKIYSNYSEHSFYLSEKGYNKLLRREIKDGFLA